MPHQSLVFPYLFSPYLLQHESSSSSVVFSLLSHLLQYSSSSAVRKKRRIRLFSSTNACIIFSLSPYFHTSEVVFATFFRNRKNPGNVFPVPPPPLTVAKMLLERGGGGGKGVVKSEKSRIWRRGVSAKQPVFCGRRKEGGISSYHTGTRKKEIQKTFLKICVGDCRS